MLLRKRPAVLLSLAILFTSLTACGNNPTAKTLEQSLAADPRLQDNPEILGESQRNEPQTGENQPKVQLPSDFPPNIPLYPNATLESVTPATDLKNSVVTRWLSSDPSNFITSFYSDQFQKSDWQILQQPTDDNSQDTFEARRDDLQVKVSIQAKSVTNPKPDQPQTATALVIEYVPNSSAAAQPSQTASSESRNPNLLGPALPDNVATQPDNTSVSQTTATATSQKFNDLNQAPPELRQSIQDLAALGVLSLKSQEVKSSSDDGITKSFEPSKNITRREYARWLVAANNAMYINNPAKQIRLASKSTQSAFSDVSKTDVDFPVIQGLAEAGLIPSSLSGDSTAVLFRPDAPLTREQLILWKIPLDTRQALPAANLEAVNQTWGFQDTGKIDPKALRAVLADFQNGEQSNIRRVFGYTTLFQPKKPVSRAEAAAALGYFGTLGEGISAGEALKLKRSPN
ncbi:MULTISPECIES: S-layer homology domain-containing protein [Cyanophyceae]|uniref:S-layer homology domain-containing protein n=2 Tax=Cyanobacteriota TaxID=1117 RepID=UPI00232FF326|nr:MULTISPECIES: S-layer homology domain-containing protein [Cyanophyceae]MDB9357587.1 S-layer homology domain-containing protein [Nodularia spumigena CS-587/03]MDB9321999.1 S-layer homology domain-containing protein [Nodularia spumigena CS-591/07A]MDB9329101.1 S-layer homology domain-containing protein [Nodularia spumigena CS-591/04]MDB9339861.1 S-layer homology domain-containing protein [Nodularia spumigena CS-589/07]MDB9361390.1 S-layer homology domain-containing protein [Nodularia spumigen